jgi:hypothetical protein
MTATEPEDSQFEGMLTDLDKCWRETPIDWIKVQQVTEAGGFAYPFEMEEDQPVGLDSNESDPQQL